jgi:hypothetical protein
MKADTFCGVNILSSYNSSYSILLTFLSRAFTWCVNLVEVNRSVDGVADDVGVVVEAQVPQHLDAGGQRCNRVRLLRAD